MDHRMALVRIALAARLHARLTADAPAGVEEELEMFGYGHRSIFLLPPLAV
jgi:hypothetical protein